MRAGRGEHDHALREEQRLLDIVRDEQRREAVALPQRGELGLHGQARQRIELAERLVEDQQARSLTSARASATRCAMPPDS
jgi:hypothetical protein